MSTAQTMKSVRLHGGVTAKLSSGFKKEDLEGVVVVEDVEVPKPRSGQVLIKVYRASIDPADLSMLKGSYGTATASGTESGDVKYKDRPKQQEEGLVTGSQGCGRVVAYGGGIIAWRLVGKKVAFVRSRCGAWGEYAVVAATDCIEIAEEVPWNDCCACFTNPFTVIAFVQIAQAGGHRSILHTAAASVLGKQLIRHGNRNGVDIVCVVRREQQARACIEAGAKPELVFNSSDPDFKEKLSAKCAEINCTLGFCAVSGALTGDVLYCMPSGSTVRVYGGLSEEAPTNISTKDLIFRRKTLSGFWLTDYVKQCSMWNLYNMSRVVAANVSTDFAFDVADTIPVDKVHDALVAYTGNMGGGKVVLNCNLSGEGEIEEDGSVKM